MVQVNRDYFVVKGLQGFLLRRCRLPDLCCTKMRATQISSLSRSLQSCITKTPRTCETYGMSSDETRHCDALGSSWFKSHGYRVRTVMENLEKSWNFKMVVSRPGKVMEKT